jgi:hypothetical protein
MISLLRLNIFIVLAFIFLAKNASAQHKELLQPQTSQQIKKFKELGVKIEYIGSNEEGDSSYEASYVDTSGRKTLIQMPNSKTYMMYDEIGRIIRRLDSVMFKDSLIRKEYFIDYHLTGHPSIIQSPDFNATFRYNLEKRELEEIYIPAKGEEQRRFYRYDANGNIIEEVYKAKDGEEVRVQKYEYNKDRKLVKETITETNLNGSRTFYGISYTYDGKGNLSSRQVATVLNYPGVNPDPNVKRVPKYKNKEFTFVYDENGNQIREISKDLDGGPGAYTVEKRYDKNGLIISYESFDYKNRPLLSLFYKYEYHNKRK